MIGNIEFKKDRDLIVKGLEKTYKRLVIQKRQTNSPFVLSKNGKVVEVSPHEMPSTTTYKR